MAEKPRLMKAARWHARSDIRVDEVPVPRPADDEVLVKVLHCGICGSDLEEFREGPLTVPVEPHPVSGRSAPITLGHEVVGVVARAAANGVGPQVGTLVVPDVVDGCGHCWWCLRHEPGLCPDLVVRGQQADGGLAEYMTARASSCVLVPPGVPSERAALAEPVSVAVRAVRHVQVMGGRVAVIGAGTIGQLVAQVLMRAAGARSVLVVDPDERRLALVARLAGADTTTPDQAQAAFDAAPEPGFDAIFECTGRPGQLRLALERVRAGGTVVAVGLRPGAEEIPLPALVLPEKRLIGTAAHVWDTDVADAIQLIADGRVDVDALVTHRVPLGDLVTDGMGALEDARSGALKVLIDCG
jgi:2-desacetyl-2-hydroxyethyl bacteriochlorophyllide A dehydrogenase